MNPKDFDPGPLAHVEHHADGERSTLVFVRHLRHSPAKVWAALTAPEQLRQWAPFDPDRDLATTGQAVGGLVPGRPANGLEEHAEPNAGREVRVLRFEVVDEDVRG